MRSYIVTWLFLIGGVALAQDMTQGVGLNAIVNNTYVGPGDVVTSAVAWYGLRAYNRATVNTKSVNVRRASDNATRDLFTNFSGFLDITTANSFCGGTTCYITKIYDKGSGGVDLAQSNTAIQPILTFNCQGGSSVCATANGGGTIGADGLQSPGNTTGLTLPFTYSGRIIHFTTGDLAVNLTDSNADWGNSTLTTQQCLNVGSFTCATIGQMGTNIFNWYTWQVVLNGASSVINADGTEVTLNPGSTPSATKRIIFDTRQTSRPMLGAFQELGIWAIGFSAGQRTAMCQNQQAFWSGRSASC
jgi:hypothetical protein